MVPVEHYTAERIPNPSPTGELSHQEFQKVRNAIVRACRKHGPTGGLGEFPVGRSFKSLRKFFEAWEPGDPDPAYYVVDDQYNDELYQYVECLGRDHLTEEWILDLMQALADFPSWGVGICNINDGYILVFSERLMVTGPCFAGVEDLSAIVAKARKALA